MYYDGATGSVDPSVVAVTNKSKLSVCPFVMSEVCVVQSEVTAIDSISVEENQNK